MHRRSHKVDTAPCRPACGCLEMLLPPLRPRPISVAAHRVAWRLAGSLRGARVGLGTHRRPRRTLDGASAVGATAPYGTELRTTAVLFKRTGAGHAALKRRVARALTARSDSQASKSPPHTKRQPMLPDGTGAGCPPGSPQPTPTPTAHWASAPWMITAVRGIPDDAGPSTGMRGSPPHTRPIPYHPLAPP